MKFDLPQIFWHGNRERIMSIDFGAKLELVTAGTDLASSMFLRLWQVQIWPDLKIDHIEDLGTHERSVNIVRFSPCKQMIASGSDDTCIIIWEKKKKPVFGEDKYELGWGAKKILRGHSREVHDLCWNSNSHFLLSGSLDGSLIIFDIEKGKCMQRLENSKPIHGVAWFNNWCASLSTDRSLRIYEKGKKGFYIKHCIKEYEGQKLFQDEVSSSAYFRKLDFSPDGRFLITSAGIIKQQPCVHLFLYENFAYPSVSFPVNLTNNATALAVRFCPVVFKSGEKKLFRDYGVRTVWAVACKDSVLLFNSDQDSPIAALANPHYSSITDVAWYEDKLLAICSTDGYVSFLTFSEGELGERTECEKTDQDMELDPVYEPESIKPAPQKQPPEESSGKRRICPQIVNDSNPI